MVRADTEIIQTTGHQQIKEKNQSIQTQSNSVSLNPSVHPQDGI